MTLQTRAARLVAMKGQIAYFYGDACGYFPIDAGIRDDSVSTGVQMLLPSDDHPDTPNARTWHYYDPERPDLLDAAAEAALQKADTYGNTYLTRTLFDRKRATKDMTKTSRIIAIEDAPADLPLLASRVLRTSPQSRQSFYRLTEAVSATKAEKLSRLIARAMGADKSGVNANKVLRLCGGYNTKAKCGEPFLVHVECRARDYTYQELWDAYSALLTPAQLAEVEAKSQHDRTVICWPDAKEQWVTHWSKHIGVLMDGRMPRVFKLAAWSQGYKIFGDASYIAQWRHEGGSWDASTVRWVRAANLIRGGCTDEMAAAILQTVEDPETIRIKGKNAVHNDIRQSITEARERETDRHGRSGYDLVGDFARTRQPAYDIPATGQQNTEPTHGGRLAVLIADTLLTFYHKHASGDTVLMTRAEIATTLHVSPATIYRLNAELKTRGEIAIEHTDNRQRSIIRLLRLVKTPAPATVEMTRSDAPLQSIPTPQTTIEPPQAIGTHLVVRPVPARVAAQPADEQHKMRSSPTALEPTHRDESAPPSPYDLARAFFASAVDPLTGEVWERHTFARFKRFAAAHGPCHMPTLSRAFAVEQKRARFDRRDAADITKARAMRFDVLQRTSRALGTQAAAVRKALRDGVQLPDKLEYQIDYADGTSKKFKTKKPATLTEKYAQLLLHRAGIYAAEEARREQSEQEHIARIGYSLTEQAQMLDLVDQVRIERKSIGRAVTSAGCVPPNSAPAGAPDAKVVIANLFARQGRQYDPADYRQQAQP
jgi:hypothetical protein